MNLDIELAKFDIDAAFDPLIKENPTCVWLKAALDMNRTFEEPLPPDLVSYQLCLPFVPVTDHPS